MTARLAELVTGQGPAQWPDDVWGNFVPSRRRAQGPGVRASYRREQAGRRPIGFGEAGQPNR